MGQSASEQCKCVGFCGPEEPGIEERTQIETQSGQAYPQTLGEQGLDAMRQQPEAARQASGHTPGTNGNAAQGFGDLGQDDALGFLPPPPMREEDSYMPPPAPAPARGGSSPARGGGGGGGTGGATASLDEILSDLEGAEHKVYSSVFNSFGAKAGYVGMDNAKCKEFLLANTAVIPDEFDLELLKACQATMDEGLGLEGFLGIMLNHAIDDGAVLNGFLGSSSDGESVSAMECRNCLLLHCQQKLNVNFTEDRFDAIFTMVMMSAGVTVQMEEYVAYCRRTARIVRLIKLCGH